MTHNLSNSPTYNDTVLFQQVLDACNNVVLDGNHPPCIWRLQTFSKDHERKY